MSAPPYRYRSHDEDSARWLDFAFRPGDIVISTRSKSGTTWMQMICALLVFQTPELPAPLTKLSPWFDWIGTPTADLYAHLAAQQHRRFIKTHTPLDGVPIDSRVSYIVVARHPLDLAISLYHHGDNLDRERISQLTGQPDPAATAPPRPPLHEWLLAWIDFVGSPRDHLDSLPGVMWHLADAWARRDEPNVVLVHYDDLAADLDGTMRELATRLGITIDERTWPQLVHAATFEQMRRRADALAPDPADIIKDPARFFRRGSSGAAREVLSPAELDHYYERAAEMLPAEPFGWLHRVT